MKLLFTLFLSVTSSLTLHAEKYVLKISELDFDTKSKQLSDDLAIDKSFNSWTLTAQNIVSVRTPLSVQAFISPEGSMIENGRSVGEATVSDLLIAIDTKSDKPIKGYLDVTDSNFRNYELSSHAFTFDPSKHKAAKEEVFALVKAQHNFIHSETDYLGQAWFHQQSESLNREDNDLNFTARDANREQFSLYTGGRAISDNLSLDRQLRLMGEDLTESVVISSLKGITVKEIDWKNLLPAEQVPIDALAMAIPEDQHVLISPSLADLNKIVELLEKDGSPLAQSFTVRNPFRTLPSRYKRRLGIDLPPALLAILPVKSVAITGFDPFFPTGTDVAILLETDNPAQLLKMITATVKAPDTHIAALEKAVVITNSKLQLERLQKVASGELTSLGSLDEYKFFRHRYPIADKSTGFVFLSDACIRRWGGPQMRIAAARRTKSIAALNHLTATQISLNEDTAILVENDTPSPLQEMLLGKISSDNGVIQSSKMGNLHWIKPSIEMQLGKVTKAEADAYAEWRQGYEEGWAKVFDPIGFSFKIDDKTKELDLTVMPLTVGGEYTEIMDLVGKSTLSRDAKISAKEHIATLSFAIDKDGETMTSLNRTVISMVPEIKVKPFSWLGNSITLFAETNEHWQKFDDLGNNLTTDDILLNAPIGFRVEHSNKLKLAMFLTALKTTVQAAAPDTVKWTTKAHGEVKYVVLSSDDQGLPENLQVCYIITNSALIITMREEVLKRAIDRENEERKLELTGLQNNADHLYLNADSQFLMALTTSNFGRKVTTDDRRRQQSYRAIPILNVWKKLAQFEKQSPVAAHQQRFGEDIYCPGGKGYQWNEVAMTMESVTYGHPAKQKSSAADDDLFAAFRHIESGIKFENDGLRVKLKFTDQKPAKKN